VIRPMVIGVLIASVSSVAGIQPLYDKFGDTEDRRQDKTPASVTITPGGLDFGDQVAKKPSNPQRLTITNTGEKDLYINSAAIAEGEKDDFNIVNDKCTGATVASNKSCIVDISFTPSVTGVRKSTLVLMDNAADSPQKVVLTGNGINSVRVRPPE
jgi:trimeric autotransporter adhesin